MPRQYLLPLSTLNRLPLVQDIALQIMHDLGFKTKRAEFVLSPMSFTTSRKTIITPYSYASIRYLSAVTSCICAPTCKPSNGQSFNFPFLNIKRHLIPPFQLPPINHFFTPLPSLHSSLILSPPNVLLNRHFLSPSTSSFPLFKFYYCIFWFFILVPYTLSVYCVLACTPHPLFSITLTYFKKKPPL